MPINNARFWDRAARKYAAAPIQDEAGYERTLAAIRAHLKPESAVFEFGCGTGTTALKLAPSAARYLGTDISPEMIAIAREKAQGAANVTFEAATPEGGRWEAGSFDVVIGLNVLHLVADRGAALAGVHRLLRPGGLFISKTPCLKEMNPLIRLAIPLMQAVGKAPYVAVFNAEELEAEIAAAGFEITERARHGSGKHDARIFLAARKL